MQISKTTNKLLIVLLTLSFLYVCFRAVSLDITHDEAYSFLNIKKFWYAQFLCNANSHWINSAAMKVAVLTGNESNWALRWFSIVSSAGIFTLCYFWLRDFQNNALKISGFALVALNPFVLDYFVLARGYASGMFFEVLSLFMLIAAFRSGKNYLTRLALLSSALSTVANFNYFYFFLAFVLVYFYWLYFKNGFSFFKNNKFYFDSLLTLGTIFLVLRALLFIKRCSNDFALGTNGFVKGLFASYLDGLIYKNYGENDPVLFNPAIVLCILVFGAAAVGILKYKQHNNPLYLISSVILSLISAAILFNHVAFGVLYPYYRSALPFFPLMIIVIVSALHHYFAKAKWMNFVFIAFAVLLTGNFLRNANSNTTFDFYHQSDSKIGFDNVEKLGAKKVGMSHEHYGVYINYYQASNKYSYTFKGDRLNTYDASELWKEDSKLENFDYLILYPPYELKYYKKRPIKFSAVKLLPFSKTVILKVER